MPTSNDIRYRKLGAVDLLLVPEKLFGIKAPHKRGMEALRVGLLNMSKHEENVGRIVWCTCFGEYWTIAAGTSSIRFHQRQHK